jgi:hypothetical protein
MMAQLRHSFRNKSHELRASKGAASSRPFLLFAGVPSSDEERRELWGLARTLGCL